MIVHGGLVAMRLGGLWKGALIEGPSGSGKSDLALRALSLGLRLAADDRTLIWPCQGRLFGRAPPTLHGRMEVRSLDIVAEGALTLAEIILIVRCVSGPEKTDRLAPFQAVNLLGVTLPVVDLWPFEPSAAMKLQRSICHIGQSRQGAYQASLASHTLP